MFSAADSYERFMGRWSAGLATRFVAFAGVRDGDAVLDVGCGTGAVAGAVAAAAPAGRVVGLDMAPLYVARATERHGSARVRFEVGDAQQMPFASAEFDRALSMLNLNFIPDLDAAVNEMTRVTRRGGTVAAAVWDYGDGMQMLRAFWDEAAAVVPHAGAKDERHMRLCRTGELGRLWATHQLIDVVESAIGVDTRFTSFDDYWQPFLEGQGPAGALVAGLSADVRDQLRDRLKARLIGDKADGAIALTARAWAVRGTVEAPTAT